MPKLTKTLLVVAGPVAKRITPGYLAGFIRSTLDRAIDGVGPLPAAIASADRELVLAGGDRDRAIKEIISSHVKLAGAQGFLTNIGGIIYSAATIPANIAGLALVECHMIAAIAHLRGYPLHDTRTRNAVLACMVGEDALAELISLGKLPYGPRSLAEATEQDPATDDLIAKVVAAELIAQVGGKKIVTAAGRRIPLLGGAVGMTADAFRTWRIGRFSANALAPRKFGRS
jgi:hypothetical protein